VLGTWIRDSAERNDCMFSARKAGRKCGHFLTELQSVAHAEEGSFFGLFCMAFLTDKTYLLGHCVASDGPKALEVRSLSMI
jgi:hypothetical protein